MHARICEKNYHRKSKEVIITYNPSIPQATDLISQSQGQILANFGQLNSQFGVDHTAFNTGSGNGDGFHKKVMFNVPWAGSTTMSGTQVLFYSSNQGGVGQLAYANSAGQFLLTGPQNLAATAGYIFLPGGLIMQWTLLTLSASVQDTPFVYPKPYSTFASVVGLVPQKQAFQDIWIPNSGFGLTQLSIRQASPFGAINCWVTVIGK